MDDRISRQAVIDALCSDCSGRCIPCECYPCREIEVVNGVPVQPERKKGKWIRINPDKLYECSKCSECGYYMGWEPSYCPRCGAEMDGGQNG